jgi:dsRNA-specific ribonuclease
MRFLTKIKINEDVVSKGMGPNKRDAKIAASQILLQIICP